MGVDLKTRNAKKWDEEVRRSKSVAWWGGSAPLK